MQYREWRFIDKSKWGDGPWLDEPDKVQWQDEDTGLPCLAVRQPESGHWCGYVGLSEGHRYFGADYDTPDVHVHGGLTFFDYCSDDHDHGICHIPELGEPDRIYWFGFDCHHFQDRAPGFDARMREIFPERICDWEEYRTLAYVRAQCESLAAQLFRKI